MSEPITDPKFSLDADCLFSKWGFGDGDALDDWWWDNFDEAPPFDTTSVLRHLVRTRLIAAIEDAGHTIAVYEIETIHNPIRAESLDGQVVNCRDFESIVRLPAPVVVMVTREQIERAAAGQLASSDSETGEHS